MGPTPLARPHPNTVGGPSPVAVGRRRPRWARALARDPGARLYRLVPPGVEVGAAAEDVSTPQHAVRLPGDLRSSRAGSPGPTPVDSAARLDRLEGGLRTAGERSGRPLLHPG